MLQLARPVGADRRVDPFLLHRRDEPPGLVDRLGVGVGEPGILGSCDSRCPCRRTRFTPRLARNRAAWARSSGLGRAGCVEIHGPEADGDAVAAHEAVLVGREPDETALAGDRLIQSAEVEQGIGSEGVALGAERPEVSRRRRAAEARGGCAAFWAKNGPAEKPRACDGSAYRGWSCMDKSAKSRSPAAWHEPRLFA